MAHERNATRCDTRLKAQPGQADGDILGKARHRGESLVIAIAVTTRINQKHGEARRVQRWHHRAHHRRVGAPAMHHQYGRDALARRSGRQYQPAEQATPARASDLHFAHGGLWHACDRRGARKPRKMA